MDGQIADWQSDKPNWQIIKPPVYRWQCTLMEGYVLHSVRAPNAFHRFMQRLAFGFRWERQP